MQLCLALAGLALQFPDWQETAVQSVIDRFGQTPATVPTLLEFLTVLPEEITGNTKIPLTVSIDYGSSGYEFLTALYHTKPEEYKDGVAKLLTDNAKSVINLLTVYITAPGMWWIYA